MQALERAIAQRVPVEGLARTSPLGGLRRRRVGAVDVAAQSVAAVAPAGVALTNPSSVGHEAGAFAVLAVLTTVVVVVMLAATVSVFARRIASTGSLYTFATRGLGRTGGIIAGTALALGYAGMAVGCLLDAARRATAMATGSPADGHPWLVACFIVAFGACVAVALLRGVRISTRVLLVIEILAVGTIAAVATIVFAAAGWNFAPLVPSFEHGVDLDAVLSGVAVGLVAFVGFESGAALGPEARRPLATVPRAIAWTVAAVCLSYLVGASAQLVGAGALEAPGGDPDAPRVALATLGESAGVSGIGPLVEVIVILSWLACTLATTTALVRLAFAMSREGLLPAAFGRTSPHGAPTSGARRIALAVIAVPLLAVLIDGAAGLTDGVVDFVDHATETAGIIGYLLAYVLVAVAAPVFLGRIGEFRWTSVLPAGLTAAALGATFVHYVAAVPADRIAAAWCSIAAIGVASAFLISRVRRRPDIAARLGLYDSPIATDTIGGRPRAGGGRPLGGGGRPLADGGRGRGRTGES
ncbi:APC family permease [Agromyces sp. MMS24-K17]|uniref:APC family permease n=1 Tax=Agromyces sp. MMS24-K17 TaxID=3372850 RepID=UPI00375436C3